MVTFLIGIFISIPIGLVINLASPWVQSKLAVRNSARRTRKIKKLQDDLNDIEEFRQGRLTNRFIARVVLLATFLLCFLAFAVLGTTLALVASDVVGTSIPYESRPLAVLQAICIAISLVSLATAAYAFANLTKLIEYVIKKNDRYKKITMRALRRLDASPSGTEPTEASSPPST